MGRRITSTLTDFGGGIVGGISPYRRRVRHLQSAENVLPRPLGAVSVRKGSQRFSSATLASAPHSAMEWVTNAGVGHIFVGADGPTNGSLVEAKAGAFTAQTTPYALGATTKMVPAQLNGALWVCENAGANPPAFFRSSNPANTFHTGRLPRPAFPAMAAGLAVAGPGIPAGATLAADVNAGAVTFNLDGAHAATATAEVTLTFGTSPATFQIPNCQTTNLAVAVTYDGPAAAAGTQMTLAGAVTAGAGLTLTATYRYRLRYRYADGSSPATTVLYSVALAGAQNSVNITTIANEIRSDYLGWTLERTKSDGTATGPFYLVADSTTAAATTYLDVKADADLGYRSDENVHGDAPHLDGVIAFKDRLVGWQGSNLWFSQAVADIEATGIANWNALNVVAIGPDDGENITNVVLQVDRLVILKRWSVWGGEGDDISSFRVFPLYSGAGCAGCRAAAAVGAAVYFWGEAGFHRVSGNDVEPFGWTEVGHLFNTFKAGQSSDVVVKNYLGQYVLVAFSHSANYNDDMLVYDLRFRSWWRITGWNANDIVVQKAGTFGAAQAIVFIDRKDRDAGAGFDYPLWLGFSGFKDEKASNGTGGSAPTVLIETPPIDDGQPDVDKDWESIQMFLSGTSVSANVEVEVDGNRKSTLSVGTIAAGAVWDVPNWDAFIWSGTDDSAPIHGIAAGTVGRRYIVRLVTQPTGDMGFSGYALDGILQPKSDYSRG